MAEQPEEPQPRIVIDEGWKSRVEAEKEELARQQRQRQQGEQPSQAAPQQPADRAADTSQSFGEMPPASFPALCTLLATQALAGLGQVMQPDGTPGEVDLASAQFFIDLLEVLEEKTKGNLSGDESQLLDGLLHELRLGFVAMSRHKPAEEK